MDRYKSLFVDINFFFSSSSLYELSTIFVLTINFFVINFNLSVNLFTFKIFNPHTWKSLSFTTFSFFCELWVLVLYLFYLLMTLLWRVCLSISLQNMWRIRLTPILSLFILCIRKVKIMLISLKCHVLSPQNAHSFSIFSSVLVIGYTTKCILSLIINIVTTDS